jgi:hypothetical protein
MCLFNVRKILFSYMNVFNFNFIHLVLWVFFEKKKKNTNKCYLVKGPYSFFQMGHIIKDKDNNSN